MSSSVKVMVELPADTSDEDRARVEQRAHEAAVLSLWESGRFSTRDAAADLGLAYHEFLALLAARGIPVVDGGFDTEALETAKRDLSQRKA